VVASIELGGDTVEWAGFPCVPASRKVGSMSGAPLDRFIVAIMGASLGGGRWSVRAGRISDGHAVRRVKAP